MMWKQFYTPITSINAVEAKRLINELHAENITLLDVRQPQEYQAAHIPGATLLPVGELHKTLETLDTKRPIIIYCATGGRSRVAAQMLEEEGFSKIYNLTGGIRDWNNEIATGSPDLGLELFSGSESAEQTITIGYGLEQGLREFYLEMSTKMHSDAAVKLLNTLADIEILHQKQLVELYNQVTGQTVNTDFFETEIVAPAMEGGLTTEQYLNMFQPDLESELDILALAMSIEGQALDLYQRAANRAESQEIKQVLQKIANEERAHIAALAKYIDQM